MNEKILVVCYYRGRSIDLLLPTDMKTTSLLQFLNEKFSRPINRQNFIRCENPTAMILKGKTIDYYGLHTGSILYI